MQEISEEDYEYLSSNVEIIDKNLENDLIVITPTPNGTENNKEFQLTGVAEDKVKVDSYTQDLLSVIQENITKRFRRSWKTKV